MATATQVSEHADLCYLHLVSPTLLDCSILWPIEECWSHLYSIEFTFQIEEQPFVTQDLTEPKVNKNSKGWWRGKFWERGGATTDATLGWDRSAETAALSSERQTTILEGTDQTSKARDSGVASTLARLNTRAANGTEEEK